MAIITQSYRSPVGFLSLAAGGEGLIALRFSMHVRSRPLAKDPAMLRIPREPPRAAGKPLPSTGSAERHLRDAIEALDRYFEGRLREDHLVRPGRHEAARGVVREPGLPALAPAGTRFQLEVWKALLEIPQGEVRTYGEIARLLGRPGAARAVGLACRENPIAILVPCHRVVRASGGIGGFAAGAGAKRWLLAHENASLRETLRGA